MPTLSEIENMRVGIWSYTSGTAGAIDTATLASANDLIGNDEVRVLTITAIAGSDGASFQVDNRPVVVIPPNAAITLTPNGTLINPIIAFVGTISYTIEFVTNNFLGSSEGDI